MKIITEPLIIKCWATSINWCANCDQLSLVVLPFSYFHISFAFLLLPFSRGSVFFFTEQVNVLVLKNAENICCCLKICFIFFIDEFLQVLDKIRTNFEQVFVQLTRDIRERQRKEEQEQFLQQKCARNGYLLEALKRAIFGRISKLNPSAVT